MAKKRRASKRKKINPTFFVFCEGETEEAYVHFLKRHFRLPSIQIHSRVSRNNITAKYIKNYKQDKLVSNPCIELWFLLHYKNHQGECESDFCAHEMRNRNRVYQKGTLSTKLEQKLGSKMQKAVTRAKALEPFQNPSSTVYRLIEALKEWKN